MEHLIVWSKFVFCVLVILFLGKKVARYGDIIAYKTGLGGVWIGLILLALLTSLPELFTGVSSILLVGAPDITVGNVFGANTYNLLNLALLDIANKKGSLFRNLVPSHKLTAKCSIVMLIIAGLGILLQQFFTIPALGWIGWYTPVLILLYIFSVRKIYLFEKNKNIDIEPEEENLDYASINLKRVYILFTISSLCIIGAGTWLAIIGDEISIQYGWGQSFVGSLFIGLATTLPEVTVSFSAIRIGAIDMAVSNMIGSNLFNLIIVAFDDILYTGGSVAGAVAPSHLVTVAVVLVMSLIFIAALKFKPQRHFRLSWFNISIIILFLVSAYFSFTGV